MKQYGKFSAVYANAVLTSAVKQIMLIKSLILRSVHLGVFHTLETFEYQYDDILIKVHVYNEQLQIYRRMLRFSRLTLSFRIES